MTEPTQDTLTQRLDRLERANRWWKVLGGATLLVLASVLLGGAAPDQIPDEIRAKRFILVSEDGKTSAELFTLAGETTVLHLSGKPGHGHAWLTVDRRGLPSISFYDNGNVRVFLGRLTDGSYSLRFTDKDGKVIWKAP